MSTTEKAIRNGGDTATLFATLDAVKADTSTVEGDIDLLGILGLSDQVRNGSPELSTSRRPGWPPVPPRRAHSRLRTCRSIHRRSAK